MPARDTGMGLSLFQPRGTMATATKRGTINDPFFTDVVFLICKYPGLSGREMKYLLWRFYFGLSDKEIANKEQYKDKPVGRAAVNIVLQRAYRKIKLYILKRNAILKP
jgi:hypothetical protein